MTWVGVAEVGPTGVFVGEDPEPGEPPPVVVVPFVGGLGDPVPAELEPVPVPDGRMTTELDGVQEVLAGVV